MVLGKKKIATKSKSKKTVSRRKSKGQDKEVQTGHGKVLEVKTNALEMFDTIIDHWEESITVNDSDEELSKLELKADLHEKLLSALLHEQLKVLKRQQIILEFNAAFTFWYAAGFVSNVKLFAISKQLHKFAKSSMSLGFALGHDPSLKISDMVKTLTTSTWQNVADAIKYCFKTERRTIENFEKLQVIMDQDSSPSIISKKLEITHQMETLMDLLKDAKLLEDFFEIDQHLLRDGKSYVKTPKSKDSF